jgi:pimeloyl-ACP methyl ester carboxylesterase
MKRSVLAVCTLVALAVLPSCQSQTATQSGPVDGTVASADGVPIHYRAEGSGSPALVFVHCWSGDGSYWDGQLEYFSPTHRVVTIDLGGHGQSGLGRDRWTMAAFGADVRAVVEKLDLKDVVLIGHSMGGAVIVEAALSMPDRVRGLVGVDNFQQVSFGLTPEQIDGFVGQMEADFATNVEPWVRSMFQPDADSLLVNKVARDMASGPPEVGTGALRETLTWYTNEAPSALEKLPAPLHCISSDKVPTDVDGLSAIVNGYKLRLMPGRGHFLMLEDPGTFNSLLKETVDDLTARP